jgi:hypothetical protein
MVSAAQAEFTPEQQKLTGEKGKFFLAFLSSVD